MMGAKIHLILRFMGVGLQSHLFGVVLQFSFCFTLFCDLFHQPAMIEALSSPTAFFFHNSYILPQLLLQHYVSIPCEGFSLSLLLEQFAFFLYLGFHLCDFLFQLFHEKLIASIIYWRDQIRISKQHRETRTSSPSYSSFDCPLLCRSSFNFHSKRYPLRTLLQFFILLLSLFNLLLEFLQFSLFPFFYPLSSIISF